MRIVLQRVSRACVRVDGNIVGKIATGALVLLGAESGDEQADLDYAVDKTLNLRIFSDGEGKMNHSILDIEGEVLAISQFTLLGDARKGRRPSFTSALEPAKAKEMYENYVEALRHGGVRLVQTGIFAADMLVELENDGPVTILIDSKKRF